MENAPKNVLPVRMCLFSLLEYYRYYFSLYNLLYSNSNITSKAGISNSWNLPRLCTSGSFSRIPRGISIVSRVRDKSADLATTDPNRIRVVVLSCESHVVLVLLICPNSWALNIGTGPSYLSRHKYHSLQVWQFFFLTDMSISILAASEWAILSVFHFIRHHFLVLTKVTTLKGFPV